MDHVTEWKMRLYLYEHDDRTTARVVLNTGANTLEAEGDARNPHDPVIPEIGGELAVARALADLSAQMLRIAQSDAEALTGSDRGGAARG